MTSEIAFELNGQPVRLAVSPTRRVIDLLREDLQLTGSKEGCGTGECGACTILVDDSARVGCLMVAAQLAGTRVTTVEGLSASADGALVEQAFAEHAAIQCGYCTPGMEIAATALLRANGDPSRAQIKEALAGNLCRCTGYVKIVDAVEHAADAIGRERSQRSQP